MNILQFGSHRLYCRLSKPCRVLVVHRGESHQLIREVLKSPFEGGLKGIYREGDTPLPPQGGNRTFPQHGNLRQNVLARHIQLGPLLVAGCSCLHDGADGVDGVAALTDDFS